MTEKKEDIQTRSMALSPGSEKDSPGTQDATPRIRSKNVWINFMTYVHWYRADQTDEEKRLILKLDLSILIWACISFFTKYLDQASLTNAYVSGMREELNFKGNDINFITAAFWASYCTFMIPACYFMIRYPANIVLPALEFGWGLSTFGLAWARNIETVYAMRFLTGMFECCAFTGTIYIIGSWYKPQEMARRISFFYLAAPLGSMFAGYLQAAAYINLNGVNGLSGWRWLFIVDAIITLGVALTGYFLFPDIPSRKRPFTLTEADFVLARKRLEGITAPPQLHLSKNIFRRVLTKWQFYLFVLQWTLQNLNAGLTGAPFSYYLLAKGDMYSVVQRNTLPTIGVALSIVSAIVTGIVADRTGRFGLLLCIATVPTIIGAALLVAYDVGEAGRLAGFIVPGLSGAVSPVCMSWASILLSDDAEVRSVITASMNAIGQALQAGLQVVQFPASEAPNFAAGFRSTMGTTVVQLASITAILYLASRDNKRQGGREGHGVARV